MPIGNHEIERLAALARLKLNSQDIKKYSLELALIIEYFNHLQDVDIHKLTAFGDELGQDSFMREDKIAASLNKYEALSNAPETDGDYFLVPRVIKR